MNSNAGGLWNYSPETGLDKNGELVHSSMYEHLWSNAPKEALEIQHYTFNDHFGQALPGYPPRPVILDYIMGRAQKYNVFEWVTFNTLVKNCTFIEETNMFIITTMDVNTQEMKSEEFSHVLVCTGHFSTPNQPKLENEECFNGRILHSHDFRDGKQFKDQDVLVVGSSYSAEDIGMQCQKYGAKTITSCYRTNPMDFKWPENWNEIQNIVKFGTEGNKIHFKDGSERSFDAVIQCTGYLHNFKFIQENLRLPAQNKWWLEGLYKGVMSMHNEKLFYIGMSDQAYTFTMFDVQAYYVRDIILGKIAVPDQAGKEADNKIWFDKASTIACGPDAILFQSEYCKHLNEQTD